ncbi:hypothetical protein BGZ61DRAFT_488745 [Ilyonectria robusta]|uniref:uncharacterized protein n=1 Tax=Ilyonectria robusta TaxID=1079257 RepID=UPI001E8DEEED|nr:uncharacterized protein BGZ61DRAFT_488745 [Ilyonectria robusta]KAH8737364.1 hypothetical protein BGZ61DRAFT_488745 [Ilyonectria robusta]
MPADQATDDILVIGIDFGTTFSGVAWAYSGQPDEIEQITNWDTEFNHCSDKEKTPTSILYGDEDEATMWGYSIPPNKDALKWFKLLLLDDKDISKDVSASSQLHEARRLRDVANKDPAEIISCFLRNLWNHSMDSIRRSIGAGLLQNSKFHVVVTMPAIWPHYAQQRMKRAVNLSGDTIVVCDAGGGTVDLISYIIESVDPFVVKECVKGDGGLCGGVFLDEEFVKLIKRKMTAVAWNRVEKAEQRKVLNDSWEHGIKPQFENQSRTWLFDLPEGCGVKSGRLKRRRTIDLSSEEILSVFSPVVKKILKLVEDQVQAVVKKYSTYPKYIILVGGFGRSRYLFNRLQAEYRSDVLQGAGNKPWTAICRGAVVHGLMNMGLSPNLHVAVGARIARISYGIEHDTAWIEGKHQECDKRWNEPQRRYQATNQMHWFLVKGADMNSKKPVTQSYFKLLDKPVSSVSEEIWFSSTSPPPSTKDSTVHRMCQMAWNQKVSFESLPTWTNSIGKVYHRLNFDIKMACEDGTVEFMIYYQGKRVGGQHVEVEFD